MSILSPNGVTAAVEALDEVLEDAIGYLKDQIQQAATDENFSYARTCAEQAELLGQHQRALRALETDALKVVRDTLNLPTDEADVSPAGLRTIFIEISEGMINQHLLTLTEAVRRGVVKLREEFSIQPQGGIEFTTDLIHPGNKLRERGAIRRFYETWKIADGDRVILQESSRGKWRLIAPDTEDGKAILDARKAAEWAERAKWAGVATQTNNEQK